MNKPEFLIIGAGPAGYVCAIRLAQLGKEVVIVEKNAVGGVCLNYGCIPTKTLVRYANLLNEIIILKKSGVIHGSIEIIENKLAERVSTIVQRLRRGIEYLLKKNNVILINGEAKFINPSTLLVFTRNGQYTVAPRNIIIATGSEQGHLTIYPDKINIVTSNEIIYSPKIPRNLVIVGGGAIGVELGCIYNRLGTKVTIVELKPHILPDIDFEISDYLCNILRKQNIEILLNTMVKNIRTQNGNLQVILQNPQKELILPTEKLLIAVGRKANIESIDISKAAIDLTEKNFIKVNEYFETSRKNIYAIGDVIGPPLLAHKAMHDGVQLAELLSGVIEKPVSSAVPLCIYTDPEVASVGLTEDRAQSLNLDIEVVRVPLQAIGRAHTMDKTDGFVKLVVEKKAGILLGAHLLCPEASSLISELTLAINLKLSVDKIIETIHPHPTLSEAILEAASLVRKKTIHVLNN
jgi:dihydrolipoamide dehydrogenase